MSTEANYQKLAKEHAQLKAEVEKIANYIAQAKVEILSISLPPEENGADKTLATAATELEEVVRHTEEATNRIMDRADAIMQASGTISDATLGEQMNAHALGILEECSFQDITGQRIRKVLKTLEQVELRLTSLIKLFGGTLPDNATLAKQAEALKPKGDAALMNGPQLGNNAPSQDDVDKLFSSL